MRTMKLKKIGAALAALLWVWGIGGTLVGTSAAEAAGFGGFRGGGGGFRSGGGFGGFRGGGRGFGGFGGFRSSPRPPSGGFGGFRSTPRSPEIQTSPPPLSAPGTPRLGTAPAPVPTPAMPGSGENRAPSSIGTPLPSARPGAPEVQRSAPSGPSSITTPLPSARPGTPSSSGGLRFSTRPRPGDLPASRGGYEYQRGWGGVYVPPGYGYWHVAPYHWLWWVGWPSPYPVYGMGHHASLAASLLMTLVLLALVVGVIAIVMIGVRRMGGSS